MKTVIKERTLSILPTRRCTASCRHCGSLSNPGARDSLSRDEIFTAIREAARLNFKLVVFTGGEATLEWDILTESIRLAHGLRMRTRLVTNAHWAKSIDDAAQVVSALAGCGLDELAADLSAFGYSPQ